MLRLDANEGRCLLSEKDLREILSPEIARRYPVRGLLEKPLAAYLGVPEECVLATAGADDAIDRAVRTLAGPGGLVMSTHPGFVEFLAAAQRSSARYDSIPKDAFGSFPIDTICEAVLLRRPQLLILSSPDNPSGCAIHREELDRIAQACRESKTIFIFDATYVDFSPSSATPEDAFRYSNVLVSGSFSKSRGLAGFRIGYIAGNASQKNIIVQLAEAGPPYSLSSSAIEAGQRALALDPGIVKGFVQEVQREVLSLRKMLIEKGYAVSESEANFVLVLSKDANAFESMLREKGILVRTWGMKPGYEGLVRITVPGDAREFEVLTNALADLPKGRL